MPEMDRPKPGLAGLGTETEPAHRLRWDRLVLWILVSVALAVGGVATDVLSVVLAVVWGTAIVLVLLGVAARWLTS